MSVSLKEGAALLTNKSPASWRCTKPLDLSCIEHGERILVPCRRWRTCRGCAMRKQWELTQRFRAGIEIVPADRLPMFFTLTFPLDRAPDEDGAHAALRALVRRLRRRGYLDAYGWVLQRQRNGTLHFHGIAHMSWFADGLAEWRDLIQASGFGIQNRLVVAEIAHAGYCARYISTRLASLAPLRRAFAFSRDFPRSSFERERIARAALAAEIGMEPECEWVPGFYLR